TRHAESASSFASLAARPRGSWNLSGTEPRGQRSCRPSSTPCARDAFGLLSRAFEQDEASAEAWTGHDGAGELPLRHEVPLRLQGSAAFGVGLLLPVLDRGAVRL